MHEGCDRTGYCEQGQFANTDDSQKYLVKLSCWSPVAKRNAPMRGDRLRGPRRVTATALSTPQGCRANTVGNLVWSCLSCNTWQSDRMPEATDRGVHYPRD